MEIPMNLDYVAIEKRGACATVRFDRKQNLNAFNEKLVIELTHVARSFHDDLTTQTVVLAGAPNGFSAGFDLKATDGWITEKDDLKRRQRAYAGVRLCRAWEEMPQITIAAMERLAVGAGVAIALACDWRVLGRGAYLYVPEVKIGLNLQWGALPRLISLVGPARAKRITLMCEKMPASQALAWGLVDELADDGHSIKKACEMAEVVLSMPAAAVRMVKQAVNATAGALHAATAFADADQSQLTASYRAAQSAREGFRRS
jgi:enoyl-CoA hydratase